MIGRVVAAALGAAPAWALNGGILVAGALALVGLRAWDVSNQQAKGAAKVVEVSKKEGAKANAKNDEVRRASAAPGAVDRLRRDKSVCGDC